MPPIYTILCQQCLSHLQGWKTNFDTATPIYQETINKVIPSYDFSLINSYLPATSDKCLRYATSNKPCFSVCCSLFVGTLLKTIELTRRQFINIFKVCTIVFVWIVQTVLINDINSLLTIQRSLVNVLLNQYCIYTT